MSSYRVSEFTHAQRLEVAMQMLLPLPEREWGLVSQLARLYGVSRTLLYDLRDRTREAIQEALQPHAPGRPAETDTLQVDKPFIQHAVTVLSLLKGSVRDIQLGLELLLGVSRSVGFIQETLTTAGEQARALNQAVRLPEAVLGEADEIFQGRHPCLSVVDGRSFLVLNLTPSESRDATSWGVTYLDLMEQGIQFHDLACDGAKGLRAGVQEAGLSIPLRPDLFHLLREATPVSRRLQRQAYQALETAERARRADLEARGILKRRGRPLKLKLSLPQAQAQEAEAIQRLDAWEWLRSELRQALEPFTSEGALVEVHSSHATLQAAIALLRSLDHKDITAFADRLEAGLPELLAPLEWLQQQCAPLLETLEADTQAFLLWCWRHRQALALDIDADLPQALRPIAWMLWDRLALFHRSSSLAEALHSWLRPYLQIHRGMPSWLMPLLQLFWNHHRFQRGKRAGSTPLELAGVEEMASFSEALNRMFATTQATEPA